jgi:8-oxo-dGTP diphosphatase
MDNAPRVVTAAIAQRGNLVLIARRGPGERLAGLWEFPGGKLEPGETPESCLARELREEFGVEVVVQDFFMNSVYHYGHGAIDLHAYFVAWPEQPHQLHVHDEIRWVPSRLLLDHTLAPADIPIAIALAGSLTDPPAM